MDITSPRSTNAIEGGIICPKVPVAAIKPAEIVNVHVVKKGDTLYSISKRYKISVTNLKKWNNLEDNILQIGQELTVK